MAKDKKKKIRKISEGQYIQLGTPSTTIRLNPLEYMDENLKESLKQVRDRDGLEAAFELIAKIYTDKSDDQIRALLDGL